MNLINRTTTKAIVWRGDKRCGGKFSFDEPEIYDKKPTHGIRPVDLIFKIIIL